MDLPKTSEEWRRLAMILLILAFALAIGAVWTWSGQMAGTSILLAVGWVVCLGYASWTNDRERNES